MKATIFLFSMKKYDYESSQESALIYKITGGSGVDFSSLKNLISNLTKSKFDLNNDQLINAEDNAIINSSVNKNLKILYLYSSLIKDHNNDGEINILDVVNLVNFILGINEPDNIEFEVSDMNSDNSLNVQDIIILINEILSN